ncbi:hypothetical protein CLOM_g15278 [Closterium sp. NIES-68]|nr:hypothetical protein CLOM_g15278 [Closterium sp. NIES-68]GJP81617.1 hypothetical protein CLOP_g11760 [Closterium sp. NIES-67]GJP86973.1 hypothetical protein CLOP_g16947 [Closterium sp. NIES-67]
MEGGSGGGGGSTTEEGGRSSSGGRSKDDGMWDWSFTDPGTSSDGAVDGGANGGDGSASDGQAGSGSDSGNGGNNNKISVQDEPFVDHSPADGGGSNGTSPDSGATDNAPPATDDGSSATGDGSSATDHGSSTTGDGSSATNDGSGAGSTQKKQAAQQKPMGGTETPEAPADAPPSSPPPRPLPQDASPAEPSAPADTSGAQEDYPQGEDPQGGDPQAGDAGGKDANGEASGRKSSASVPNDHPPPPPEPTPPEECDECAVAMGNACPPSTLPGYNYSAQLYDSKIILHWSVEGCTVHMALEATQESYAGNGWLGIGWSDNGQMAPADAVIGNTPGVAPYEMTGYRRTEVFPTRNFSLGFDVAVEASPDCSTIIKFSRENGTGSQSPFHIEGKSWVVWAHSRNLMTTLSYHGAAMGIAIVDYSCNYAPQIIRAPQSRKPRPGCGVDCKDGDDDHDDDDCQTIECEQWKAARRARRWALWRAWWQFYWGIPKGPIVTPDPVPFRP